MKSRGRLRDAGRDHPPPRPPGGGVHHPRPRGAAPPRRAGAALRRDGLQRPLVQPRARGAAVVHGHGPGAGQRRGPAQALQGQASSVDGRRSSTHTLYDEAVATFEADEVYDQADAAGFIRLNALRLRTLGSKRISERANEPVCAAASMARSTTTCGGSARPSSSICEIARRGHRGLAGARPHAGRGRRAAGRTRPSAIAVALKNIAGELGRRQLDA